MREIKDQQLIRDWVSSVGACDYFDTPDLEFQAFAYDRQELISSPVMPLDRFLFVVQGTIQIYSLHDDGSISPINTVTAPMLLGDVEFCGSGFVSLFAEAKTKVICLSLPFAKYKNILDRDVKFLHHLLSSLTAKLDMFSTIDALVSTLEERLLMYLRNICPNSEIVGMDAAAQQLHCSRRQLQRVVKQLCLDGTLEKTGRGRYRLVQTEEE